MDVLLDHFQQNEVEEKVNNDNKSMKDKIDLIKIYIRIIYNNNEINHIQSFIMKLNYKKYCMEWNNNLFIKLEYTLKI